MFDLTWGSDYEEPIWDPKPRGPSHHDPSVPCETTWKDATALPSPLRGAHHLIYDLYIVVATTLTSYLPPNCLTMFPWPHARREIA